MNFTKPDDIQDSENKYLGIVALSLSDSGAPWNIVENTFHVLTGTHTLRTVALVTSQAVDELFATIGVSSKANPTKENLIKQIQNIPTNPDFYDADEQPPDEATKGDAKQIILGVIPSGLLAGADVYGYYREVNISWETQRRKLKLIVPPRETDRQPFLYHGQMQNGIVTKSNTEQNVTARTLRTWLDWLQG